MIELLAQAIVFICMVALLWFPLRAIFKIAVHVMDPMKGKDKLGGWEDEN